jgi:hypothetical protein
MFLHGAMMRLFLVCVFSITLIAQSRAAVSQTPNTKPSINSTEQKTTDDSPRSVSVRSPEKIEIPTQTNQANTYDATKDILYRRYLCATIIGVIGGFLGVGILIWQTVLTRRSADAARDAAGAARSTAEAVVNSERPWLFLTISTTQSSGPLDENGVLEHLSFSVSFRNCGKTPAEVVGFEQHVGCYENDMSGLPSPPRYASQGQVMAHTRMVPPGEEWRDIGESYFLAEQYLSDDDWKKIRSSQKRLVYWGRLQYRDLIRESKSIHDLKDLGLIHETCFCYFWSPPLNRFLVWGTFGYNKHT